ncbi:MAG: GGDEF domain-containing protein [Wenzhouxiangellaceae bacterium]|nr:GGDEF domain-containing protein [Wenzhouxiangellaceae bacterium]
MKETWRARIRTDYRLALVTLFMVCTIAAILPFAVYRFAVGEILVGIVDMLIVSAMVAAMIFAWRTGRSELAGILGSAISSFMSIFVVYVIDLSHLWAFAALVANFLLAPRLFALGAGLIVLASIGFAPGAFDDALERTTFLGVGAMVSIFSLVFASLIDMQSGQLARQARRDPLTGVGNRRAMEEELTAFARGTAAAADTRFGLVLLDLDHFKRINDDHGHEAGDRVLKDFTTILSDTLRRGDLVYRYGGEEFVVVLPGLGPDDLGIVLEKLQSAIRESLRGPAGAITASMGAARFRAGEDWRVALADADKALYDAKRVRNCWRVAN